jgi:hypothetical protein
MARETETNPRTIPDARIAARMTISVFRGADTTPKRPPNAIVPAFAEYNGHQCWLAPMTTTGTLRHFRCPVASRSLSGTADIDWQQSQI